MQKNSSQDYVADYTSRQYISHMLSKIGLNSKAAKAFTAPDHNLDIYIELIKLAANNRQDIKELLEFSGLA